MENQPKITPSTDAQWKNYYMRKMEVGENQLRYVADKLPHILRLAMGGKRDDVLQLMRLIERRLEYPRDRDPLTAEIAKHYSGSPLREEVTS